MATHNTGDDCARALDLYAVNHTAAWGTGHSVEYQFWKVSQNKTAIPRGTDRDTAIQAAGTALGVTVDASSPWLREQQFWAGWLALPPTAAA